MTKGSERKVNGKWKESKKKRNVKELHQSKFTRSHIKFSQDLTSSDKFGQVQTCQDNKILIIFCFLTASAATAVKGLTKSSRNIPSTFFQILPLFTYLKF